MVTWWIPAGIFTIALLYASVGHGGASGYLALLAVLGFEQDTMRSSALLLNIVVSGIAFFHYYRAGHFSRKVFLPFAVASVPMAWLGGLTEMDAHLYNKILGACLLLAVLRIASGAGAFGSGKEKKTDMPPAAGLLAGGLLGFVSGTIGIGGGIILSPLLLLFHWAGMKTTAGVSALFIFVNSLSGTIGLWQAGHLQPSPELGLWTAAAVVGALLGSYAGSFRLKTATLSYFLSFILAVAGLKLLLL